MYETPRKPHDTRLGIFKHPFKCRVRQIDMMDEDRLLSVGMLSTGDREIDRALAMELVPTYLTIEVMLEKYFRKGLSFWVIDPADTKKIYEFIQAHIVKWRSQVIQAWDVRSAPLEDLVDLDRLASTVYKEARHHFNHNSLAGSRFSRASDRFAKALGAGLLFTATEDEKLALNPNHGRVSEEDPHAHLPERDSLEDLFLARLGD